MTKIKRFYIVHEPTKIVENMESEMAFTESFYYCEKGTFFPAKESVHSHRRRKIDKWGGDHIHIFVFCIINFF